MSANEKKECSLKELVNGLPQSWVKSWEVQHNGDRSILDTEALISSFYVKLAELRRWRMYLGDFGYPAGFLVGLAAVALMFWASYDEYSSVIGYGGFYAAALILCFAGGFVASRMSKPFLAAMSKQIQQFEEEKGSACRTVRAFRSNLFELKSALEVFNESDEALLAACGHRTYLENRLTLRAGETIKAEGDFEKTREDRSKGMLAVIEAGLMTLHAKDGFDTLWNAAKPFGATDGLTIQGIFDAAATKLAQETSKP